jgi:hypothetical protein
MCSVKPIVTVWLLFRLNTTEYQLHVGNIVLLITVEFWSTRLNRNRDGWYGDNRIFKRSFLYYTIPWTENARLQISSNLGSSSTFGWKWRWCFIKGLSLIAPKWWAIVCLMILAFQLDLDSLKLYINCNQCVVLRIMLTIWTVINESAL